MTVLEWTYGKNFLIAKSWANFKVLLAFLIKGMCFSFIHNYSIREYDGTKTALSSTIKKLKEITDWRHLSQARVPNSAMNFASRCT